MKIIDIIRSELKGKRFSPEFSKIKFKNNTAQRQHLSNKIRQIIDNRKSMY